MFEYLDGLLGSARKATCKRRVTLEASVTVTDKPWILCKLQKHCVKIPELRALSFLSFYFDSLDWHQFMITRINEK